MLIAKNLKSTENIIEACKKCHLEWQYLEAITVNILAYSIPKINSYSLEYKLFKSWEGTRQICTYYHFKAKS